MACLQTHGFLPERPPQGPPHLFPPYSSQHPQGLNGRQRLPCGRGGSSVSPSATQNFIFDSSFPQSCSGCEEFIHTGLTRDEENILEGKPFLPGFPGGHLWSESRNGCLYETSIPCSGSRSSLRAASWRVCAPRDLIFRAEEEVTSGEDPPGPLWVSIRCRRCPLSDQAVFPILF